MLRNVVMVSAEGVEVDEAAAEDGGQRHPGALSEKSAPRFAHAPAGIV